MLSLLFLIIKNWFDIWNIFCILYDNETQKMFIKFYIRDAWKNMRYPIPVTYFCVM